MIVVAGPARLLDNRWMSKVAAVVVVLLAATTAARAEPTFRMGLTYGIDGNIPEAKEYGPLAAVGLSTGRFGIEAHYAYISFMDPDQSIHRIGIGLRADLWRRFEMRLCNAVPAGRPCVQTSALYGELGAARRFGQWRANDMALHDTTSQREVAATIGYELGLPGHCVWQLGLRVSMARRDPELGSACRGSGCVLTMGDTGGMASSAMLEWAWLFGH